MTKKTDITKSTVWMTRIVVALFVIVALTGVLAMFSNSSSHNDYGSNSYAEENPFK